MKKMIVIAGPTASGKTALAVELAKRYGTEIISADSRQFYKEMSVGTAKPLPDEMQGIKHHFIGSHSVQTPLSAGQYEKKVLELTEKLFKKYDVLILTGGSGMFLDAVIYGTDNIPHSEELRKKWNEIHEEKGLLFLQKELEKRDPVYFEEADIQNPVRLIRALEVMDLTGKAFSSLRKSKKAERNFKSYYFVLTHPRESLYKRIDQRVIAMMNSGLIEEVKRLSAFKNLQALNTVGYKEVFLFLDGEITESEAIALIQKNTRNYAKRQMTWFRRNPEAISLAYSSMDNMLEEIHGVVISERE
ncbi:MAG: tRNA (adenosine(37)-N6)-dimethylallyltransferase MiaA [Brumimicrobium sp.]|nr:tRNA (adenosine(37)-N6)-dimethylallyltransferase MiaA [Brumimicrobium sp.]